LLIQIYSLPKETYIGYGYRATSPPFYHHHHHHYYYYYTVFIITQWC